MDDKIIEAVAAAIREHQLYYDAVEGHGCTCALCDWAGSGSDFPQHQAHAICYQGLIR